MLERIYAKFRTNKNGPASPLNEKDDNEARSIPRQALSEYLGTDQMKNKGKQALLRIHETYLKPIFGGATEEDYEFEREEDDLEEEEEMRIFAEDHRDNNLQDISFFNKDKSAPRIEDDKESVDSNQQMTHKSREMKGFEEIELGEINH